HAQPADSLARLFGFLGAPEISRDAITRAIEFSRFENMRKMEAGGGLGGPGAVLRPADRNDEESFKTRKGKVGGYTSYFTPDDVARIGARVRERLVPAMGYAAPGVGPALREPPADQTA